MINSRAMRCRQWQDEPGGGGARGGRGATAGRGSVEAKTMKRRYLNEARTTNFSERGLAAMGLLASPQRRSPEAMRRERGELQTLTRLSSNVT